MDSFPCPFVECGIRFALSSSASVLAQHVRRSHPKQTLPNEFKLPAHITLEQCNFCLQLYALQRGGLRKHKDACSSKHSGISASSFHSAIPPNSRTDAKAVPKAKPQRVGLIASVLQNWKPKAQQVYPQPLASSSLDRKSDRKAPLVAPRPLPSLIQMASHGSLRRTLAKELACIFFRAVADLY